MRWKPDWHQIVTKSDAESAARVPSRAARKSDNQVKKSLIERMIGKEFTIVSGVIDYLLTSHATTIARLPSAYPMVHRYKTT